MFYSACFAVHGESIPDWFYFSYYKSCVSVVRDILKSGRSF